MRFNTEEKGMVVFESQHKHPLKILLEISVLKRSTYYYALSKTDKDMNGTVKNQLLNKVIDEENHKPYYE